MIRLNKKEYEILKNKVVAPITATEYFMHGKRYFNYYYIPDFEIFKIKGLNPFDVASVYLELNKNLGYNAIHTKFISKNGYFEKYENCTFYLSKKHKELEKLIKINFYEGTSLNCLLDKEANICYLGTFDKELVELLPTIAKFMNNLFN